MPLRLSAALIALTCSACGNFITGGDILTPFQEEDPQSEACTPRSDSNRWPVKVLFITERSGSMCVMDPPGSQAVPGFCDQLAATIPLPAVPGRVRAISAFYDQNAPRPNLSASILAFHTSSQATPFEAAASGPPQFLWEQQSDLGKSSDLQGGLDAAATFLAQDMETTTQELRARTKYVVVVLSKGVPFPRCSSNDSLLSYATPADPSGPWADSTGAERFCNQGSSVPEENLPGFEPGGDRNQNAQLISAVERIMGLKEQFGVGDVRMHTVLLFDSKIMASCGPICQDIAFGPAGRNVGRYTLGLLAQHGRGTFIDPGPPQQLTLESVDTSEFPHFCP
jgi:hypothetical protein